MNAHFIRIQRIQRDTRAILSQHREKLPYAAGVLLCLVIYIISIARDSTTRVYRTDGKPDFKDARVLGSQGESLYEGKEHLLNNNMKALLATQALLREKNDKLQTRLEVLEKVNSEKSNPSDAPPSGRPSPLAQPAGTTANESENAGILAKGAGRPSRASQDVPNPEGDAPSSGGGRSARRRSSGNDRSGNSIISFPVKDIALEKSEGIVLPAGSYVKARLMTGVEAPEGKTYPVLLQLDYAYIIPNQHKLDLAGCFMIAKSQGDLSTERVQMQANKLSCVSKDGKMFEREVNGFIADDKDNSFAVIGSVNSKQDRVAATAFLSSIVEGVGKAIQQAQTTQTTTPLGGAQSVLTGNAVESVAAGGASNAAGLVTQWYLKQAQNLLPTINVGSGQDVWVVMQDTVKLPQDFFRKSAKASGPSGTFTYLSRILD